MRISDNKALKIYAKNFPEDAQILDDALDPRRKDIAREMRGVINAKTVKEAARIIEWWEWPGGERELMRTVREIRKG